MFDPWLKYFKSSLVTKTGGISKQPELPTGNRMWQIAARSNARPKVVKLNGKIINGEQNETTSRESSNGA